MLSAGISGFSCAARGQLVSKKLMETSMYLRPWRLKEWTPYMVMADKISDALGRDLCSSFMVSHAGSHRRSHTLRFIIGRTGRIRENIF